MMACEDFRVGGAQVFALRLAWALFSKYEVWLYSQDNVDEELIWRIASDDEVYSFFRLNRLITTYRLQHRWFPDTLLFYCR